MKLKYLLLTMCLWIACFGNTLAFEQEVQLVINELKIFSVFKLQKVAVGDPEVVDIVVLSDKEVMLLAKHAGVTSLIIWDEAGQRSFNITVIEKDLEKVAQRVRTLLVSSDVQGIRVKIEGDKIYLIGEVLTERELEKVNDVIVPFANTVNLVKIQERQPLVEIDVNILEVNSDDLKKIGMDWSAALPITYSEPSGSKIDGKVTKLWKVFRWDRTAVTAKLNFLIENDKARNLANPKLICLSGKEASFLVGGEVPFVTVTSGSTVTGGRGTTQVEWREYGVNLKVRPLVNSKNEIKISMEAEVSELDLANAVTQEGFQIPAIKTRKAQTELFLNEEDTIFLAGLIKDDDSTNIDRLPWLGKIPILGELFKSTRFQNKRTELVISLTPRIIGEKANPEYLTNEMIKQETILNAQRHFQAYSEENSPLAYYTHMIEDIISRGVAYPVQAQEEQQEGIVEIKLHLLANGQLKDVEIKKSSGFNVLDEAVLVAVQELAPYPSFPSQVTQKELRLAVPVVFKSYVKNE